MAAKVEAISKIKRRYPKEWLLLTNVVADKLTRPIKGKLVAHSKNRDDIYDRLKRVHGNMAVEYAGDIPTDLVFIPELRVGRLVGRAERPMERTIS